jgi:hypothetical protein
MCIFCAAVPAAAATGLTLENRQRRCLRAQGKPLPRLRLFLLLTLAAILLLLVSSVLYHTRFLRSW